MLAGDNGAYLSISPSAYNLLKARREGVSFAELAVRIGAQAGRTVEPGEVEAAYKSLLGRIRTLRQAAQRTPSGFLFRLRLLPKTWVERAGALLAPAFLSLPAALLLAAVLTSVVWAVDVYKLHRFFAIGPAAGDFWWAYGLFALSVLFHELGHASACVHHGARPSEIGFTIYLVFPAFYSDVTDAWQLRRGQRVVIDLAGIYFQAILGSAYLAAYRLTHWEPLWFAWMMIATSAVFMLNPILKFDGYWAVADLLGVMQLSRQPVRIVRHWVSRALGRPVSPLPWPLAVTLILGLYTIVSFGIWILFLVFALPMVGRQIAAYPALLRKTAEGFTSPAGPPLSTLFHELSVGTFMVLLAGLVLWRLVRPLWSRVKRRG